MFKAALLCRAGFFMRNFGILLTKMIFCNTIYYRKELEYDDDFFTFERRRYAAD